MILPRETPESPNEEDLTQKFKEGHYDELTAENWFSLVGQGLDIYFFNNFHAVLPGGYRRPDYEERVKTGGELEELEKRLYPAIDQAIQELDAKQLLKEKNPLSRLIEVRSIPYEKLSGEQKEFFIQLIALYKKLRKQGFSHWDLVG